MLGYYANQLDTLEYNFINAYRARSPLDRGASIGYCTLVGSDMIIGKSTNQTVVARSSVEDNRASVHITFNPVFHERTKSIKAGSYFI